MKSGIFWNNFKAVWKPHKCVSLQLLQCIYHNFIGQIEIISSNGPAQYKCSRECIFTIWTYSSRKGQHKTTSSIPSQERVGGYVHVKVAFRYKFILSD